MEATLRRHKIVLPEGEQPRSLAQPIDEAELLQRIQELELEKSEYKTKYEQLRLSLKVRLIDYHK